jgi:membrane protein implicated in regulation of membrane protease activity
MTWWLWEVLGLALAVVELATPGGFFIIFFGISALVIGALVLGGLLGAAWIQWALFPLIALAALRLFRQPLLARIRMREKDDVDSLTGEVALAAGDIPPGGHGRAELRGTTWSAHNVGSTPLRAGQRSRVVAVHGLTIDILSE